MTYCHKSILIIRIKKKDPQQKWCKLLKNNHFWMLMNFFSKTHETCNNIYMSTEATLNGMTSDSRIYNRKKKSEIKIWNTFTEIKVVIGFEFE